jgi:hypothetical protein
MNQKLVQSLVQIITSLSDEERQCLERELQNHCQEKQIADLEHKLKKFENQYQMSSQNFYQKFQNGELGDSTDFFEWNTYYEMLTQVNVPEKV